MFPKTATGSTGTTTGFMVRINVFLASKLGISRRQADRAISDDSVRINGIAALLGQTIDPLLDHITVNGTKVENREITQKWIAL